MTVRADGDDVLVAAIAAGDRGALAELYRRHAPWLLVRLSRRCADPQTVEEVVQDTFVGFWNAPEKYDSGRGSLRTFLLTIAHRRAVDIVRSEVARARREEKPPDPDHYDVADEVWTRNLSELVRKALDELAEGEREAISLAYFGGLSYVEVAKRLGEPEGTVKSRIRSGMKKLAVSLSGATA